MKKSRSKYMITFALLILVIALYFIPNKAYADENLNVRAKVNSLGSVKLTWDKHSNVKKWVIRKANLNKYWDAGNYKKVKTIKKGNSCKIKHLNKKKYYEFEVLGYIKKKGKFLLEYEGVVRAIPGMAGVNWDDYIMETKYSPTAISINGYMTSTGYAKKGYEVWRRIEGQKKYKRIAVINKKGSTFYYTDKKVTAGKTYQYKVRTYGRYKRKKIYSSFSTVLTKTACNQVGTYSISRADDGIDEDHMFSIYVESNKKNGRLEIGPDADLRLWGRADSYDEEYPVTLVEWSKGSGSHQMKPGEKLYIDPGDSVFLKFSYTNLPDDLTCCKIETDGNVKYDDLYALLEFPIDGTGRAYEDGEMYH